MESQRVGFGSISESAEDDLLKKNDQDCDYLPEVLRFVLNVSMQGSQLLIVMAQIRKFVVAKMNQLNLRLEDVEQIHTSLHSKDQRLQKNSLLLKLT